MISLKAITYSVRVLLFLNLCFMFMANRALNGCMAVTVISDISDSVDCVEKENKIKKLEKKRDEIESKGTGNGTKLEPTVGNSTQKDMQ